MRVSLLLRSKAMPGLGGKKALALQQSCWGPLHGGFSLRSGALLGLGRRRALPLQQFRVLLGPLHENFFLSRSRALLGLARRRVLALQQFRVLLGTTTWGILSYCDPKVCCG